MAKPDEPKTPQEESSVADALDEAKQSLDEVTESVESAQPQAPIDRDAADPASVVDGIDLLGDVDLHVSIELGRAEMLVEDVLRLANGSVVELDKLAGDPVDVYVNGRLVARGEVLVLNDNFCIRISEIVDDLKEQVEAVAQQEQPATA